MSNSPRLETAIKEHLAPALRSDGFTETGRTFRRLIGDFIQVVGIQGSRYGGQFAINLAIQPLGVPDVLGRMPDVKKITDAQCEFRRRLAGAGTDQWWTYESTPESMANAVMDAATVYVSSGRPLLDRFASPHSPLKQISAQVLASQPSILEGFASTTARTALVLARMREAKSDGAAAIEFARVGLASVGSAVGLQLELERICSRA